MVQSKVTAEQIINAVGHRYNRFGFPISGLPFRFAEILNDPSKSIIKNEGEASEAAELIRKGLAERYTANGNGALATCHLFYKLGRQSELGGIKADAPGFICIP